MKALTARIRRLEADRRPAPRVRSSVVTIDARTGAIIGPKPKGKVMVVYHHGNDDEWEAQLQAQQARLIESAQIEGTAQ